MIGDDGVLYINIGCNEYIEYNCAKDPNASPPGYIDDGTATFTITGPIIAGEPYGIQITPITGTLSYVSGSNGDYSTVLEASQTDGILTPGQWYSTEIVFTAPSGAPSPTYTDTRIIATFARNRGSR